MAEQISQFDEFKKMLDDHSTPYVELEMQTLIVKPNSDQLNIRQYHDDFCLSSWVNISDFKEKIQELLKEG